MTAIVANGQIDHFDLKPFKTIIACDGGLLHLDRLGITPSLIIGDFDSVSQELLDKYSHIKQVHLDDQNYTDLEKTLHYLEPFDSITVIGALGKRTDHTLTNLILLSQYKGRLFYENEREKLYVLNSEEKVKVKPEQTLSLIPLNGAVSGITTVGLKWELKNGALDKNFVGISNIALQDEVTIRHECGDLLLCLNH
jgi:thiamine pyrophosphokinase